LFQNPKTWFLDSGRQFCSDRRHEISSRVAAPFPAFPTTKEE
jgi:hypothetical protein